MAERMLKFVGTPQAMPDKRPAAERRRDFHEIYAQFARDKAAEQAARCSQCGVPFCQIHCPLHNNIPDWLKLTAEGRLEEAYELSSATNNFPEICGRICPQDRLCEGNCVIEKGYESVTIGSVEKFITDTAWEQGWVKPIQPRRERPESVGIVGAGPGGPRRRRAAAPQGLPGHGLRPLRPGRRPADLRHPQLQAREGRRAAPRDAAARCRRSPSISNCEVGRDVTLAELRAAPRRRADRHRRLQGARHRRARRRPARHRARRSTISPPPTARAWATRCPTSTRARSTPRARTSW